MRMHNCTYVAVLVLHKSDYLPTYAEGRQVPLTFSLFQGLPPASHLVPPTCKLLGDLWRLQVNLSRSLLVPQDRHYCILSRLRPPNLRRSQGGPVTTHLLFGPDHCHTPPQHIVALSLSSIELSSFSSSPNPSLPPFNTNIPSHFNNNSSCSDPINLPSAATEFPPSRTFFSHLPSLRLARQPWLKSAESWSSLVTVPAVKPAC